MAKQTTEKQVAVFIKQSLQSPLTSWNPKILFILLRVAPKGTTGDFKADYHCGVC